MIDMEERYLSLLRRLRLTCPICGGGGGHEMGCVNIGTGVDGFDIEVIEPLSPLRDADFTPRGHDYEAR